MMIAGGDARATLWAEGLPILRRLTGVPERRARAHLGRMLRDLKDDAGEMLTILKKAEALDPADAYGWIEGAVKRAKAPSTPLARARAGQLARRTGAR